MALNKKIKEMYGDIYSESNYEVERLIMPSVLHFLKTKYKGCKIIEVRNFNKYDTSTKEDQCKHIDIRMIYKGKMYAIDAKCNKSKDGYYSCVIYEIYRRWEKDEHTYGKLLPGWAHPADIEGIPPERQIILRSAGKEINVVTKKNLWDTIERHPEDFKIKNLDKCIDSGNARKLDYNKKMMYNIKYTKYKYAYKSKKKNIHRRDLELMIEMKVKKYQLCDGSWHRVPISQLGPIKGN